jgi:hypothetical protein
VSKSILYGLCNWALVLAGLINLGVGTRAALQGDATIAATSLAAGLVLLFAGTIDRFESLKGLGIEAKTKKLDQKISQADEALSRLRELAELTGASLIDLNSKMGRWDSVPTPREFISFASNIRQIMKNMGSEDKTISQALRPWAKILCFDMASVLTEELGEILKSRQQELRAERDAIPKPIDSSDTDFLTLSEKIRSIDEFVNSRLRNLHLYELEDFPDRFMSIFEEVPQIDKSIIEAQRIRATKFAGGMTSLKLNQTLPESELWIEELNKSEDGNA